MTVRKTKLKGLGGILLRYVGAAMGAGICLLLLNLLSFIQLALLCQGTDHYISYKIVTIADGIAQQADGTFSISPEAQQALDERYVWAMQLDDTGQVIWEYQLPASFPRNYTVPEVATFTHWYLEEYPVYCWQNDMGLMVIASAPGSEWKYNMIMSEGVVRQIIDWIPTVLVLNLLAVLLLTLLLGWRMYRASAPLAQGIHDLAQGETIWLPERGVLRVLSAGLNRASETLLAQRTALQKRDRTRTEWIAGVSHDIRTPLSLVQGNAAQLETDPSLSAEARRKAALIRTQSQRIGRLVSDLNLASKLTYELQPLHQTVFRPAALLRAAAVNALNSYAEGVAIEVKLPPASGPLTVTGDEALLHRAIDNLLRNSVTHNTPHVRIQLMLTVTADTWSITVSDDGKGLSEEQLSRLRQRDTGALPTHGLGLVLVQQIARTHGGTALFSNMSPGLQITLVFPLSH